jgi:polyisoprenoid-binding protein YceI
MMKWLIGAMLALVVLAAVVAGGWWFFVRDDAELATSAPDIPSDLVDGSSTPSASNGGGLVFEIVTEESEAAYFADEELASVGLPSTAKGTTTIQGTFFLTGDGFELDPDRASTFSVDLTGLTSDQARRDNRVQEALETASFPTATFTATAINGVDASLPLEDEHTFDLTGVLDLHGVEREITWEVEARREGDIITALATTTFFYADFNITPPNIGGFVSVEDDVTLQVQVIARAS